MRLEGEVLITARSDFQKTKLWQCLVQGASDDRR